MRILIALFATFLLCSSSMGHARDDKNMYSIDEAMNNSSAKEKFDRDFLYFFGDQPHGKIASNHGEFMSNKKTNAFGKTDKGACQWVFLSAMLSFQDRISQEGGNAVVNIRSYYKKNEISSTTEFECGSGAIMAGVTFVGDVVTLEE
jgi:hypothetical protein